MAIRLEAEALRAVPIFRTTDLKTLRLLAFLSEVQEYRAGEALCRQGERGEDAFVLLDGAAEVRVATPAGPRTVATIGRHQVVGEIAVLCDIPRTADVIAVAPLSALRIEKAQLLSLFRDAPDTALELMRSLALRLEETTRALAQATAARA